MKGSVIIYGKMPIGDEKVKIYCLKAGGYWFWNKKEIKEKEKMGFRLIFKEED